jgi:hypothetical protein
MTRIQRKLVFENAWHEHKVKLRHNCTSTLSECLKRHFRLARLLKEGYK